MKKEEFCLWWKHLLVDLNISERSAAEKMGIQQQALNRKAKEGTLRFYEIQTMLEAMDKTLVVKDKENS